MSGNYASAAAPGTTRSNTMAIVSLIIGILTWVTGILFACPALLLSAGFGGLVCCPLSLIGGAISMITGYVGRNQIHASGGAQTGDGMAIAGLILGGLGVLVSVLFLCVAVLEVAGLVAIPLTMPGIPTPRR